MYPRTLLFSALTLVIYLLGGRSSVTAKVLLTPSVSGEEMYISTPGNSTGQNGTSGADLRTSVSSSLAFAGGKQNLRFDGSAGIDAKFYKKDPSLNFIAYNGTVGADRQFSGGSSFFVRSEVSYTKTSDSLSDSVNITGKPAEGSVTGLQPERTGRFASSYSAGIDYVLSGTSSAAFDISENFLLNESSRLFDTRTDSVGMSYHNRLTKKLDTTAGYSFSNRAFDAYDYSFDFSAEGGDIATHSVDIGMSLDLDEVDRVAFSGGYFTTAGAASVNGWTASTDYSRVLELVSYKFGYARRTTGTFGLSREINVNQSLQAGTAVHLNRMVGFSLDGTVSKNSSKPSGNVESRTYTGSLAVNYTPSAFTDIAFTLSTYRLESTLNHGDRTTQNSYDAGLAVNYRFSRSIFFRGGYSHFQQWTKGVDALSYSREVAYVAVDLKSAGVWYD